jgi:hypothetical protein
MLSIYLRGNLVRRSTVFTGIFLVVAVGMIGLLLVQRSQPSDEPTSATLIASLDMYGPGGPTAAMPQPTLDPTTLPQTAEAFIADHADLEGNLAYAIADDQITYRITFSQQHVNALIEPYAPELGDVSNVMLTLQPGEASITADVKVLGITTVQVQTTGLASIEHNAFVLDIIAATMGGLRPPQVGIDAVRAAVEPLLHNAIMDGLAAYRDGEPVTLTGVDIGSGTMTVDFIFAPPPPTNTP